MSQHVLRFAKAKSGRVSVDLHAPLADLGLDSLAIVALIVDLEKSFSITFPAELINHEVFASAHTVAESVVELQNSAAVQ